MVFNWFSSAVIDADMDLTSAELSDSLLFRLENTFLRAKSKPWDHSAREMFILWTRKSKVLLIFMVNIQ